ncbi:MAG: UDP-glucose/GDP-mannose dehydrogenase family protein [Alphaproteobacteria bacterium]|nr:UDP-glucose/GDP-mannose dehydrogenase family protein [Alphaproteobacteria bacterium]
MRIAMIGAGYVGLVSGACLSEFGHDVVCVDADPERIAQLRAGRMPIFEPGLEELVRANVAAGRLGFSLDLAASVGGRDAVFIAVGTPSRRGDGDADLSYVFEAARSLAAHLEAGTLVVTKSTVPVGTGRRIREIIAGARPGLDFHVASNPEFLREGAAIQDFMRPDRIVVGAESEAARETLRRVYRPLFLNETPFMFSTLETAELTKYAANAFLATKISFINEMADLCEKVGADVQDVARGIGLDGRIGRKFLHAGPGFGGSCFPKDTRALVSLGRRVGATPRIVEAVVEVNERRKRQMAEKILAACGGSLAGKVVAVLGLTFKPNTDDMRESASLVIVPALREAGAVLRLYDPEGMKEAARLLEGVAWCSDAYDALTGADALVILTEWNEFRALDFKRMHAAMRHPLVIDLRNIYKPAEMADAGFIYHSVGRPGPAGGA